MDKELSQKIDKQAQDALNMVKQRKQDINPMPKKESTESKPQVPPPDSGDHFMS